MEKVIVGVIQEREEVIEVTEAYPVKINKPFSLFHDGQELVEKAFDASELLSGIVPLLVTDPIGCKVLVEVLYNEGSWQSTSFCGIFSEERGWRRPFYSNFTPD